MSPDATSCGMALVLVLAVAASACGGDRDVRRVGPGTSTLTINERAGTYRGVGLASSRAEIEQEFGEPDGYSRTHGVAPVGHGFYELGLPDRVSAPGRGETVAELARGVLRYPDASFQTTEDDGAYAFSVVGRVRTPRGVAIGDRLRKARRRYPNFRCSRRNRGIARREYKFCTGRVQSGVYMWLGQDPIRSVTLASKPMLASRRSAAENEP